jgi:hypothetical protein
MHRSLPVGNSLGLAYAAFMASMDCRALHVTWVMAVLWPVVTVSADESGNLATFDSDVACTPSATIAASEPTALLELCRDRAEAGDRQAQYAIGLAHYIGVGAPFDYGEAARWYRLAAEQDHVEAQVRLGAMYLMGRGVERDFVAAADWYVRAAEQGDVEAQNVIAGLYLTGNGVQQNDLQAARWYRLAAEQGDTEAQYFIGALFYDGRGVERDYGEAWKWFRIAADQGDIEAHYMLGRIYEDGSGLEVDRAEAAAWFELAADQGHARAQAALGRLLSVGEPGVSHDLIAAYKWLTLAVGQDIEEARALRDEVAAQLHEVERQKAQRAVELWRERHGS